MTQTERSAGTTRDPLSSSLADLIGRRVVVRYRPDGAISDAEVDGAVVGFDPHRRHGGELMVRLEHTSEIARYGAWRVRLANPDPTPLTGDAAAERAAATWIARSRGQLAVLEAGSYNDSGYKAMFDAARDLCAAIDAERARREPCRYVVELPDARREGKTLAHGCAFLAEPGMPACGVHGPVVERYGWPSQVAPSNRDRVAEPVGTHDPLRLLGLIT